MFALAGRLYSTDVVSGETARIPAVAGVFDPHPDPTGSLIRLCRQWRPYVTSLDTGDRLLAGNEDPDVTYGTAEFIAAEEMRRSRGFWWGPTGDWLLVARVDTSRIPQWHISSPVHPDKAPRAIRYPCAGADNAEVRLELHNLNGGAFEVRLEPDEEWEYLADASWAPRDKPTLVVQSRDQRRCAILEVEPTQWRVLAVYTWTNDRWIDIVPGAPQWIGASLLTVEDHSGSRRVMIDGDPVTGDGLQVREVVQADHGRGAHRGFHRSNRAALASRRARSDGDPAD